MSGYVEDRPVKIYFGPSMRTSMIELGLTTIGNFRWDVLLGHLLKRGREI